MKITSTGTFCQDSCDPVKIGWNHSLTSSTHETRNTFKVWIWLSICYGFCVYVPQGHSRHVSERKFMMRKCVLNAILEDHAKKNWFITTLCVLGPYVTLFQQAQLECLNSRNNATPLNSKGIGTQGRIYVWFCRQSFGFSYNSKNYNSTTHCHFNINI